MFLPNSEFLDLGGDALGGRSVAAGVPPGIPSEDWDCLFRAIVERLSATTTGRPGAALASQPQDAVMRLQTTVSECVVALNRLHAMQPRECAPRAAL